MQTMLQKKCKPCYRKRASHVTGKSASNVTEKVQVISNVTEKAQAMLQLVVKHTLTNTVTAYIAGNIFSWVHAKTVTKQMAMGCVQILVKVNCKILFWKYYPKEYEES